MRGRSLISFVALLAFAMPVHAIPPPPPPPDPAAVIEADKLADELVALDEDELRSRIAFAVSSETTNWLMSEHPEVVGDPVVLRAFHLAILARVNAVWPEERSNIRGALANLYRLLMSATDLAATRAFIASPAGHNFGRMLVGADVRLLDRAATDVLYRRVFPELPGLLAAAQKPAAE